MNQNRQRVVVQKLTNLLARKDSKNFFDYFLLEFANHTNLFCLFLGQVKLESSEIRTISFVQNNTLCDNFEYNYTAYPCAKVIATKKAYHCENFQTYYPNAFRFLDPFFSYYLGFPILNSREGFLGIIVFLSNNKQQLEDCEKMIPHFSQRIGVEMQEYLNQLITNETNRELEVSNLELQKSLSKKSEALETTSKLLTIAQNQLVEQDKMATLGLLSAGIAHEINNPLNYMLSSLEGIHLILKDNLELFKTLEAQIQAYSELDQYWQKEIQPKYVEAEQDFEVLQKNIKAGIKKIADLVKSLKSYSHPAEEVFQLANLHELLQNAISILQHELRNKIELELNLDPNLKEIFCIPNKLIQVFINLIQNAIQAKREKETSKISIQTSLHYNSENYSSTVRISICDNGTGISKDNMEKIFKPFFTTKPVGEGVGLGLFICYGIIKKHRGKITVESELNKGTCFKIELPAN